jgi:hypothetical protein
VSENNAMSGFIRTEGRVVVNDDDRLYHPLNSFLLPDPYSQQLFGLASLFSPNTHYHHSQNPDQKSERHYTPNCFPSELTSSLSVYATLFFFTLSPLPKTQLKLQVTRYIFCPLSDRASLSVRITFFSSLSLNHYCHEISLLPGNPLRIAISEIFSLGGGDNNSE